MKKTSSIPDNVSRFIPCKCARIRNDNGIYRVYKYSAVKLPSGKWSSDYGYLIGKIIPDEGFCPNKRYLKELEEEKGKEFSDTITDVAYGQYALLMQLSSDILEKLKKHFTLETAAQIYAYALILCANGFIHVDQVDDFFQESFLSVLYRKYSFRMGYNALSELLSNLGKRGKPVENFEQELIDTSSKNIAIDGHVVRSCSQENLFAETEYKLHHLNGPQVNILIAYDINNKIPLAYRTYRGSNIDKKSVVEFLRNRLFKDTKFIVDKGFYSETVLSMMSRDGNHYIIPVPSNNKEYKRIKADFEYTSGEFVYKSGKKDTARIVYYEEKLDNDTRILIFKDIDENNSKRKCYKQLMDIGETGYTPENYEKYCDWWGVYVLQTTLTDSAASIYSDYKGRWSIETYNNYVKNDGNFNNLKIQDYYIENGFNFIMLVTGLIHSRLNEAVQKLNRSNISTFDLLVKAGHLRMVLNNDEWHLHNTRKKDLELLQLANFTPIDKYKLT